MNPYGGENCGAGLNAQGAGGAAPAKRGPLGEQQQPLKQQQQHMTTTYVQKLVPDILEQEQPQPAEQQHQQEMVLRHHQAEADGIAVLTAALKRSNYNLEVCHDALRVVKEQNAALQAQVAREGAEHAAALGELQGLVVEHQRVHAEQAAERDALAAQLREAKDAAQGTQETRARQALRLRAAQARGAELRREAAALSADWKAVRQEAAALPACMAGALDDMRRLVDAARQQGAAEQEERLAAMREQVRDAQEKAEWALAERAEYKRRSDEAELVRRKLHNQVQTLRGNLRVVCRVRPLCERETSRNVPAATVCEERAGSVSVMSRQTGRQNNFDLSAVLGPGAGQERVFGEVGDLVVSALDGYNVCIFAYGQTGSGKTYTMEGPRGDRGVSHRALERLFEIAASRDADTEHRVRLSMVEVYNEQVFDLLGERRPQSPDLASPCKTSYEIRTGERGVQVRGLRSVEVSSREEAAAAIAQGQAARAMAATNVHDRSSRSHCVITVTVEAQSRATGTVYYGKLNLVDLAGSECVGRSGVTGQQLREAQAINRSLSALGDVFAALSKRKKHVPYRNSKLTHLLSDSLGGDSKTLMVVCLNPGEDCVSESLNSLNFAKTASTIQLGGATPCKKKREKL